MSVGDSAYFNERLRANIVEKVRLSFIRRSGQVECGVPHDNRHDGEPCGKCRARV